MDVLIQALIDTSVAYDHHGSRGIQSRRSTKPVDGPMLQTLVKTVESCGIRFYVWEEKRGGALEWPSIMGKEKKRLLKSLPSKLNQCQPPHLVEKIVKPWNVS